MPTNPTHPAVDQSDFPVVRVDLHAVNTAEEADELLAACGDVLSRGERVGFVFIGERASRPVRDQIQEWIVGNYELIARAVAGAAMVMKPATLERNRQLLTEQNPFPFPAWVAATADECAEWVGARVAEQATSSA